MKEVITKCDLYTNEPIINKSKEFCLLNSYATRTNLTKHFKEISKEEIEKIVINILSKRIELKKIEYSLSTTESKTLIFPTPQLLYSLNIDYAAINNKLGLKNKYRYDLFNIKNNKLINNIIQDSREQNPLQFNNCKVKVEKLDVGDYSYNNAKISIERKSLLDLLGTLSKGYERFCNEIVRAENANIKLVIVVENPISELLSFNFLPQYRWIKNATPEFICSRLRLLLQSFPNIQAVFVKNREESAKLTHFILSNTEIFQWDIQHLYLTKQLNAIL